MPNHIDENPTLKEVLFKAIEEGLLKNILRDLSAEGYIAFVQLVWDMDHDEMNNTLKNTITTYLNETIALLNVNLESHIIIDHDTISWREMQDHE